VSCLVFQFALCPGLQCLGFSLAPCLCLDLALPLGFEFLDVEPPYLGIELAPCVGLELTHCPGLQSVS
jgi:hypothetical protein